jgi:hypothetical protein
MNLPFNEQSVYSHDSTSISNAQEGVTKYVVRMMNDFQDWTQQHWHKAMLSGMKLLPLHWQLCV